jgi:hypothetical protein
MADTPKWPTVTEVYGIVKEVVLGLPTMSLAQRLMTYAFLSTAFIIFMMVVMPRFDCGYMEVQTACSWLEQRYMPKGWFQ